MRGEGRVVIFWMLRVDDGGITDDLTLLETNTRRL
jgi:hypothetical protein